jgi:hypothetical protein
VDVLDLMNAPRSQRACRLTRNGLLLQLCTRGLCEVSLWNSPTSPSELSRNLLRRWTEVSAWLNGRSSRQIVAGGGSSNSRR